MWNTTHVSGWQHNHQRINSFLTNIHNHQKFGSPICHKDVRYILQKLYVISYYMSQPVCRIALLQPKQFYLWNYLLVTIFRVSGSMNKNSLNDCTNQKDSEVKLNLQQRILNVKFSTVGVVCHQNLFAFHLHFNSRGE